MTNKIWNELAHIKYGEFYLTRYLGLQRDFKKGFNIVTLLVSASGILGWKQFENYVWIAFLLIAIMQLAILIENQIIKSDKEIDEISNLRMMYTRYFNKLEKLWTDFFTEAIDEETAKNQYFALRQSDWENIEEVDCKLSIKKFKRMMKNTEKETHIYFNQYHKQ